jgi:hypothetical protein
VIVAIRTDAELNCIAKKTQICSSKTGGKLQISTKPMGDDADNSGSPDDDPAGVPSK